MKRQTLLLSIVLSTLMFATFPALGAGGTNGTLTVSVDSATVGQTMYVKLTSLDVSSDYSIEIEDVAVFNWSTSTTETTRYVNFVIPDPGADGAVKIELVDANITVIDTAYLQVGDVDDLIPTDLVQAVFIALIGLFLFAAILVGIKKGMLSKK